MGTTDGAQNRSIDQAMDNALALHQAGQLGEAEAIYRSVLAQDPDHADALALLGLVAYQVGQPQAAIELIEQSLELNPNIPWPHNNLGEAYRAVGRVDDAVARYTCATHLKGDYAEAYNNLGAAYESQNRLDEAEHAFTDAIAANPQYAEPHVNLASLLDKRGDADGAIEHWRKAIGINPKYIKAHHNLGIAYADRGELDTASVHSKRAISLNHNHADAHFNLAIVHLLKGDLERGFSEYEWRWKCAKFSEAERDFGRPMWDGFSLIGQTILVHAEQGFGDTIQFARYLPMLAANGAKVIFECQPELVSLLRNTPGVHQTVMRGLPLPAFDVHAPLMSLPRILGTTLAKIPAPVPYIAADLARVATWSQRMEPTNQLKVGIAWRGRAEHGNDRNRSMPLRAFSPLAEISNVTFYSLQKGQQPTDVGLPLVNLMDDVADYSDTAAIVSQLDLVISVDTSVVHLAGAMNKPVWTLLPATPDWRWMLKRSDSPWYPSMRLFRQNEAGAWSNVMQRVKTELRAFAAAPASRAKVA